MFPVVVIPAGFSVATIARMDHILFLRSLGKITVVRLKKVSLVMGYGIENTKHMKASCLSCNVRLRLIEPQVVNPC